MTDDFDRRGKRQRWWVLGMIGGIIPLSIVLSMTDSISPEVAVTVAIVAALVLGAMAVWMNANSHARGDEWWQDDHSSGWRGY
ncbi:MAG: hypothetical protein L0154_14065 [Chloroflexi bacterium]|nr:hypothetical protein [Chloroflexota bacterium]